ncbi:MAG: class I SAM-dependent RNA methyltransferase [Anaerolineaceae bacterium]|nr:class I SAM-dependent RNA methyltransferase [Anaerolineaceae bacterium]
MAWFDVELTGLVYGGDAIGRLPDGRAIFVPFALPGEKVRVELVEEKRGHARGRLLEVLNPREGRVAPRCPHFGVCGGCHYQHMDYAHQLEYKTNILKDQFMRIAGIQDAPVQPMVPSPSPWNYRNTVQFHLTPTGKLGYQAASSHQVVTISECHLPEAELNETWPLLDFETIPGLERLELRKGAEGEILLTLESQDPKPPELLVEMPLSVVYLGPGGATVLAGDDAVLMEVLGRSFRVSPGTFFQVNTLQAGAMVEYLADNLPLRSGETLLDVYCGVGLFSAFLAPKVSRLIGIEIEPAACEDFADNLDEFENVELYEGLAEEILPGLNVQPQVVVVDPPRSGLDRKALDAILAMTPGVIAYVSCDPATLARDAGRILAGGYRLEKVTPFDLFPQTYHIESISTFKRM